MTLVRGESQPCIIGPRGKRNACEGFTRRLQAQFPNVPVEISPKHPDLTEPIYDWQCTITVKSNDPDIRTKVLAYVDSL